MSEKTYWQTIGERAAKLADWPNADAAVHGLATEIIPEMCGLPYDYIFRDDPIAMCECTLLVQEYLDLEAVYANTDVYNFEGEAMGAKLAFRPDHCPDFDRSELFIQGPEDLDKIKFGGMDTGRIPYLVEYSKAYKRYTGIDTFPQLSAPWTIACNLYGTENLVMETLDDPDFVQELLRRIVDDFHVPLYTEVKKLFPNVNSAFLPDAFASVPMVTMDLVEEFIQPNMAHEREELGKLGIFAGFTSYFGFTKLPEAMQGAYIDFIVWGNTFLMALDDDLMGATPEGCRQMATDRGVALIAGLDAAFLENAPEDELYARIKRIMLAGKDGPTPLTFNFTCINPTVDPQRARNASYVAHFYGKQGVTADDELVLPEPLSFVDFLKQKMESNLEGYTFDWLEKSSLKDQLL